MGIKKIICVALTVVILVFVGCEQKGNLVDMYPEFFGEIKHYTDLACIFNESKIRGLKMQFADEPIYEEIKTVERIWDDPELQKAIQKCTRDITLDTDGAILAYAWDIQPVLQEFEYIPPDYFPTDAYRYSNGVVQIVYLGQDYIERVTNPEKYWGEYWDTDIYLFVSEADGHIIDYFSYLE